MKPMKGFLTGLALLGTGWVTAYGEDYWSGIQAATGRKDWIGAERLLRPAMNAHRDDPSLWAVLSWVLRERNELDGAEKVAREGLERFPGHKDLGIERGWIAFSRAWAALVAGQLPKADAELTIVLRFLQGDERVPQLRGTVLIRQEKLEEAERVIRDGMTRFPARVELKETLAWCYTRRSERSRLSGDSAKALAHARAAVAFAPDAPWTLNQLGCALITAGEPDEATGVFRRGRARWPTNVLFGSNVLWGLWESVKAEENKHDSETAMRRYDEILLELDRAPIQETREALTGMAWLIGRNDARPLFRNRLHLIRNRLSDLVLAGATPHRNSLDALHGLYTAAPKGEEWGIFRIRLEEKWPKNDQVLQLIGTTLGVLNTLGPRDLRGYEEAVGYLRRAMDIYEARTGPRHALVGLQFPIAGPVMVLSENRDSGTPTHNGYHQYAYDFASVTSEGSLERPGSMETGPDGSFTFGVPVLAVASGVIESIHDGEPDNEPGQVTLTGNHLQLRLADGNIAWYEHLRKGSIRVIRGQRVQAGEALARIGNSGYSTTPHLHFEVHDGERVSLPVIFRGVEMRREGTWVPMLSNLRKSHVYRGNP